MAKFKPPEDEKDRRLIARELYVKGKSPKEIVEITGLEESVINNIIKWLETNEYGKKWIEKRRTSLGGNEKKPETSEDSASETESPPDGPKEEAVEETLSQVREERESPRSPPSGPSRQTSQPSSPQREKAFPLGSHVRETVFVDRVQSPLTGTGRQGGGIQGYAFDTKEDSAEFASDPVTGKLAQTWLTPMVINWYTYLKGKGYDKPMHIFLEECVTGFFKARGLRMAVVQEYVS